ncbi:MAG: hypothetical protein M1470_09220 [Bacteroidetes bacterium]|nr:hypothetical protein [Bacteroidota bacterium]MCL5737867.1 hypothetical protein [Bacteroidota bacterium]
MALRTFRSGALRNEYLSPLYFKDMTYFIRFSSTKKCLAQRVELSTIFSPALIFPLVLSFVSRQRKVLSEKHGLRQNLKELLFDDICPFSFARPKENGQKGKGALRKWFRSAKGESEPSRPPVRDAILIYGGSYITEETPKIASSGNSRVSVEGGRDSIFARGIPELAICNKTCLICLSFDI